MDVSVGIVLFGVQLDDKERMCKEYLIAQSQH